MEMSISPLCGLVCWQERPNYRLCGKWKRKKKKNIVQRTLVARVRRAYLGKEAFHSRGGIWVEMGRVRGNFCQANREKCSLAIQASWAKARSLSTMIWYSVRLGACWHQHHKLNDEGQKGDHLVDSSHFTDEETETERSKSLLGDLT